jgi:hypothetical protein
MYGLSESLLVGQNDPKPGNLTEHDPASSVSAVAIGVLAKQTHAIWQETLSAADR